MQMQGTWGVCSIYRALGILTVCYILLLVSLYSVKFAKLPHSRNTVRLSYAIQLSLQNIPVILDESICNKYKKQLNKLKK